LTAPGDDAQGQLELTELTPRSMNDLQRIAKWVATTSTGDVAELPIAPSDAVLQAITVGSDECPGASQCPMGEPCFAELARRRAAVADVTVVNTYLYGLHVSGGTILPEHEIVVFDEAHGLEDIMSTTLSVQITPGRFVALGAVLRRVLEDRNVTASIVDVADVLRETLAEHAGNRLPIPYPDDLSEALLDARGRLERALGILTAIDPQTDDAKQKRLRAQLMTGDMITRIDSALDAANVPAGSRVDFVSGSPTRPHLEIAPLDVGPLLREGVWEQRTAILTSATIPSSLVQRVGFPPTGVDQHDVGSPFDYGHNAMLYCAMALPDPRHPDYRAAVHDELAALITAAGGRTLGLFTSWAAMDAAATALRDRLELPVITQRDLPKPALLRAFAAHEATTLLATAGFFQGVDVPGRTLIQVVIDRLPFPRPDDPLLSARRELLGPAAFSQIDVPRAAMMLAQAAGRLIRTASDRGVVAVLDRRLGTARYRWDIVNALPPMRRTRDRADVERFLAEIVGD
jgi:ATP-dependent DNA helicase DinG